MSVLGYVLLFYIGFYFYRLAENHKKNKWLFGILGIATYFIGIFAYPLYLRLTLHVDIDDFDFVTISLKSIIIGLLCVFILFQLLSFIWSRKGINNIEK